MPNIITDTMGMRDNMCKPMIPSDVATKVTHGELFQKINDGYGHTFLKPIASNTVVLGGAILALEKLCDTQASFHPNTLNDILSVPVSGTTAGKEKIALFGCGIGGAQLDFGNVVATDIKQNNVKEIVPMRYAADLTGMDATKYYMKVANSDGSTFSWYLKEFDNTPVIKSFWKNAVDTEGEGTEITTDISDSGRTEGIETYAQFELSMNTNDVREYFVAQGNLSKARYNSFGIYTGEKVGSEYGNVRLYAVVNFNNRSLDLSSSASFVYRLYSLT